MLTSEGDRRTTSIDLRLACLMALVAGALNAAGFQAAGLFSSNMTGNVSALADHLVLGEMTIVGSLCLLIGLFVLGATVAGLAIARLKVRSVGRPHAWLIFGEALLLLVLCAAVVHGADGLSSILVLAAVSFILGLQNATTTSVSRARVRTTHVSGMVTDIGLYLGYIIGRGRGERSTSLLLLHLGTLISFLVGGLLGAGGYLVAGGWALLGPAVALGIASTIELTKPVTNSD